MNRRKLNFVAIALLASTLVSCEMENMPINIDNNGKVGVTVSGHKGLATKSVSGSSEYIGSYPAGEIEGVQLNIEAYISDNDNLPFAEEIRSKGSIVTTESINADNQQFAFNGWLGSTNRGDETNFHFVSALATKGSGKWTLSADSNWRNGVPSSFWSYYPAGISVVTLPANNAEDAAQKQLGFSYTTPVNATDQKDILFAYNLHTVSYDTKGETEDSEFVDVDFCHALAAVRFDVAAAIADGVTVTGVYFKDVVTDGTCVISGTPGADNDASGSVAFAWTPDNTKKVTMSQEVAATDFSETGLDGTTANALMPLGSSKFFFFIPQAVSGMELGIVYTRADGTTCESTASLSHAAWEAGKIYTYKLNPAADKVGVDVIETLNANVKTDVSVQNTGNVNEFLRAAIIGNWVMSDGTNETLVGAWAFNAADFTGFNDEGWTCASDGFFYSNDKVAPGEKLDLFDSYTASGAPVEGATLNLYIMSQAVAAGDASNWAGAIAAIKATSTTNE